MMHFVNCAKGLARIYDCGVLVSRLQFILMQLKYAYMRIFYLYFSISCLLKLFRFSGWGPTHTATAIFRASITATSIISGRALL